MAHAKALDIRILIWQDERAILLLLLGRHTLCEKARLISALAPVQLSAHPLVYFLTLALLHLYFHHVELGLLLLLLLLSCNAREEFVC